MTYESADVRPVVYLAQRRKRHDDGRCAECGEIRYLCRIRGGHPAPRCPHEHVVVRTYGSFGATARRCADCGENVYLDRPDRMDWLPSDGGVDDGDPVHC